MEWVRSSSRWLQFLVGTVACVALVIVIASVSSAPPPVGSAKYRERHFAETKKYRSWHNESYVRAARETINPLHGEFVLVPQELRQSASRRHTHKINVAAAMKVIKGDWDGTARTYDGAEAFCGSCLSMSGDAKLSNVRDLVSETIHAGVPGDFVETGTWRGGSAILARAVQVAAGVSNSRRTYACDSFQGLPPPTSTETQLDISGSHWRYLAVSVHEVAANFNHVGVLDGGVRFVRGYFRYSLPVLRREFLSSKRHIAVLRGDADMFDGYYDILYNLYEFVPIGGYFICGIFITCSKCLSVWCVFGECETVVSVW